VHLQDLPTALSLPYLSTNCLFFSATLYTCLWPLQALRPPRSCGVLRDTNTKYTLWLSLFSPTAYLTLPYPQDSQSSRGAEDLSDWSIKTPHLVCLSLSSLPSKVLTLDACIHYFLIQTIPAFYHLCGRALEYTVFRKKTPTHIFFHISMN